MNCVSVSLANATSVKCKSLRFGKSALPSWCVARSEPNLKWSLINVYILKLYICILIVCFVELVHLRRFFY